jgi:hypothetical protein
LTPTLGKAGKGVAGITDQALHHCQYGHVMLRVNQRCCERTLNHNRAAFVRTIRLVRNWDRIRSLSARRAGRPSRLKRGAGFLLAGAGTPTCLTPQRIWRTDAPCLVIG